jgi:hypothetical protein
VVDDGAMGLLERTFREREIWRLRMINTCSLTRGKVGLKGDDASWMSWILTNLVGVIGVRTKFVK